MAGMTGDMLKAFSPDKVANKPLPPIDPNKPDEIDPNKTGQAAFRTIGVKG